MNSVTYDFLVVGMLPKNCIISAWLALFSDEIFNWVIILVCKALPMPSVFMAVLA
jgi:hypothetical protein